MVLVSGEVSVVVVEVVVEEGEGEQAEDWAAIVFRRFVIAR